MRKKMLLAGVGVVATLALGGVIAWKIMMPSPVSDVPVVTRIGWFGSQHRLELKGFDAQPVHENRLGLFSRPAIVEYHFSGTLRGQKNRRPHIEGVQLAERWVALPLKEGEPVARDPDGRVTLMSDPYIQNPRAEIFLTPIVGGKTDEAYAGEPVDFDIKVQDFIATGAWGLNHYVARSGDKEARFTIHQNK
ncbi:hypothetical protein J7E49_21015 [Variovorax paradoxus]|nr:hypothetical protein [Variovorax paradoxus]